MRARGAIAVILFVAFSGCDQQDQQTPRPTGPTIQITAEELSAAYKRNEIAARQTYSGHLLRITGIVDRASSDFADNPQVTLHGENEFADVTLEFGKEHTDVLSHLSPGDTFSAECQEIESVMGDPIAKDCYPATTDSAAPHEQSDDNTDTSNANAADTASDENSGGDASLASESNSSTEQTDWRFVGYEDGLYYYGDMSPKHIRKWAGLMGNSEAYNVDLFIINDQAKQNVYYRGDPPKQLMDQQRGPMMGISIDCRGWSYTMLRGPFGAVNVTPVDNSMVASKLASILCKQWHKEPQQMQSANQLNPTPGRDSQGDANNDETSATLPEQTGEKTVQAFYQALGTGDGQAASQLVIPSKRESGSFSANAIQRFYKSLSVPLKLESIIPEGADKFRVAYSYSYRSGFACEGIAVVTTDAESLISSIHSLKRC